MIVYAVIYVDFDYVTNESFVGIFGSKDKAINAAIESGFTDNIRIFDNKEMPNHPKDEQEAKNLGVSSGYFWLYEKDVNCEE